MRDVFVIVALPLLAGCAAEATSGDSRRDSAGVEIVENADRPGQVAFTLDSRPRVVIGARPESTHELHEVSDATRLSDGTIVVVNAGSRELRIFRPDGEHVRTVGRRGAGPGEFGRPTAVQRGPGDSLVVSDAGNEYRISFLAPSGEFVRSVQPALAGKLGLGVSGSLDGGSLLYALRWRSGMVVNVDGVAGRGIRRDSLRFVRLSPTDGAATELFTVPGDERLGGVCQGIILSQPAPWGRRTSVHAADGRIVIGDGARFEIRTLDPHGRLLRIVRLDRVASPITAAAMSAFRETVVGPANNPCRATLEGMLDEAAPPGTVPAYGRLLLDDAHRLWVERYRMAGDSSEVQWTVFDPEGALIGDVVVPPDLLIFEIGEDHVLGRRPGEDGAHTVVLMSLRRPS